MTWLYEEPLVVVVVGILLLVGLGIAWSSTGRKELAFAAGMVLLLMIVGVVIERLVVTDGESIRQTLQEVAQEVAANDHRALLKHIADDAPQIKQRAEKEMPNYDFQNCRVTKIHQLIVDTTGQPKTAIVELNVVFTGNFQVGGMPFNNYTGARWIRLELVQDKDGQWKVENYEHDDPQRMIMKERE